MYNLQHPPDTSSENCFNAIPVHASNPKKCFNALAVKG